jgi:chromosome partitioning protein
MRRIAFVNEKGGTCKTTLAVNLAAFLARQGRRVLLVDLDTQGHAGKSLGCDVRELRPNVYDLLLDPNRPLASVARPTAVPGLDLVPANKALAEFPLAVAYDRERTLRLARRLDAAKGSYDYVVIDSPPSAGLFLTSALLAATDVVIPVATTYLALDGCAEVAATIEQLKAEHGRDDLRVAMVVPTLYRKSVLADEVMAKLREYFPGRVAGTVLSHSVHLDEAQGHGQSIWQYAPRSKGARMMQALGAELLGRLEGVARPAPDDAAALDA